MTGEFLEAFGISQEEAASASGAAFAYLQHPKTMIALTVLAAKASTAEIASRSALTASWVHLFSEAGQSLAILNHREGMGIGFEGHIRDCLFNPISWALPSTWALFFAVRKASDDLQVDSCRAPTSESHLTGILLGAVQAHCETWRQIVAAPLLRSGTSLSLQKVDLSIMGGEQVTGGDFFAIVLDFRSRVSGHRRIVPLLFQAKRYTRPNADVSQHHAVRGFQRELLARSPCASAYIFYENGGDEIDFPLPPLVKPVEAVGPGARTNAAEGSMELATYLVTRMSVPGIAPDAGDPDEALRMIYRNGNPSFLAIISDDETASGRYAVHLQALADLLRPDGDDLKVTLE